IESKGTTIFDAIRNMINITGKRLYWAHARLVIISRDIAENGILPVLDLLFRDAEIREEMDIVISREKTAQEVLKAQTVIQDMHSFDIDSSLENQKSVAESPKLQVYQFINALEGEGISPAIAAAGIGLNNGRETTEIMGTAVFKSDKLVGFLNKEESKYFSFATDEVDKGLLIQNEDKTSAITLEIFKNKTEVKPEYYNGKIKMNIHISTEVAIAEVETPLDYIEEERREKLKKEAEESLKASVEKVIKKVQKDYDSDIFGFGMLVKAYMPSVWKELKPNWDNLFKSLDVNLTVDINIKNSAIVSKTIKIGD
ncbi:MAG TPA: Ger(x)C family spore germination protein, partial [Clostridia bacterium]